MVNLYKHFILSPSFICLFGLQHAYKVCDECSYILCVMLVVYLTIDLVLTDRMISGVINKEGYGRKQS